MPPMHAVNAPTRLMRELGYAEGYVYDPDTKEGFSGLNYFPDDLPRQTFYRPLERGFEREIAKRLEYWNKLRQRKNDEGGSPTAEPLSRNHDCARFISENATVPPHRRRFWPPAFRHAV